MRWTKKNTLPKVMTFGRTSNGSDRDKSNMLNEFFNSVFTPKHEFCIKDFNNENPTVTNFSVSKSNFLEHITVRRNEINLAKWSRLNILQKQLGKPVKLCINCSGTLRLEKVPSSWKGAAVTQIYKEIGSG